MIEVLKAYLQVANGVGDLTRQRALEAARQALAAAAVLPVASAGVDGLAAQASALADELLAAGRANRELLSHLVRAEVETVVSRLGLDGRSDLEAELLTSRARVRELERDLAATKAGRAPAKKATAKKATATPAAAKKATARKATAKKATAKKATTTPAAAKRATAKPGTATARTARTARTTPRKAATKRTTKRSSASKATTT